jgi:outer membrane protein assembly factor BamB
MRYSNIISILLTTFLLIFGNSLAAQTEEDASESCGIVDAIAYPVESIISKTIAAGYDDFGISRSQFGERHLAVDVAFREQGTAVQAMARGQVTHADINSWNTERGVVVIAHDFPDGTRAYSVYGHVEENDEWPLPQEGECVELGEAIGAVGWPASSTPHLHYEIRSILPGEGGPGYVDENPLEVGWYHPLDFTQLWQIRLSPEFVDYATFQIPPTIPPVITNGVAVAASGQVIIGSEQDKGEMAWRVSMDDVVGKIAVLPDGRIAARSRSGQVVILNSSGRYSAVWAVNGPDVPFIVMGETLVFTTQDGGLAAFNPDGEQLWTQLGGIASEGQGAEVYFFESNGETFAQAIETGTADTTIWRIIDNAGTVIHSTVSDTQPLIAPINDGIWVALADGELIHFDGNNSQIMWSTDVTPGNRARLTADIIGNTYLYVDDEDNTLLSWDSSGVLRWQTTYPSDIAMLLTPLLAVDNGCLLYGLNEHGQLNVFNATNGELVSQTGLYAGGNRNRQPAARVLQVKSNGYVQIGAGFLSLVTIDGNILGSDAVNTCSLG